MAWSLCFKRLSHSSYRLYNYIARSVSVMLDRFNIPLSRVCTVVYEVDFRPKILAHILQYMDFFAYSCSRAILTDGKQLHCRLTDANFFLTSLQCCAFHSNGMMLTANGYRLTANSFTLPSNVLTFTING